MNVKRKAAELDESDMMKPVTKRCKILMDTKFILGNFDVLPDEIIYEIIILLPVGTLQALSCTSSYFGNFLDRSQLDFWHKKFMMMWNNNLRLLRYLPMQKDWKFCCFLLSRTKHSENPFFEIFEKEGLSLQVHTSNVHCWYEGQCESSTFVPSGFGTFHYPPGSRYSGNFSNGVFHGYGEYVYPTGAKYAGQWEFGSKSGCGTYTFANGNKYIGQFENGKYHGHGIYEDISGDWYDGQWYQGLKQGKGKHYFSQTSFFYDGGWKKGSFSGVGTLTYTDNEKYEGEFRKGKKHGFGVYSYATGVQFEGVWKNDTISKGLVTLPDCEVKVGGFWSNGKLFINN